MPSKVWVEIIYPFSDFNGETFEVWKDKYFHPTIYNGCNYFSVLGLRLICLRKRAPDGYPCCLVIHKHFGDNYSGIPFQINLFILENKSKSVFANIYEGGAFGSEKTQKDIKTYWRIYSSLNWIIIHLWTWSTYVQAMAWHRISVKLSKAIWQSWDLLLTRIDRNKPMCNLVTDTMENFSGICI